MNKLSIVRKRQFSIHITVIVAFLLISHPTMGNESQQDIRESVVTNPAVTTAETVNDGLIAAARIKVNEDPSNAFAHISLGYLLIKKGALDEAMLSFDEALKLNPHASDAKTGKGIILAKKGHLQEAEEVLKDALLLNPNPVKTHYELGLVYEKLGNMEQAIDEFKEAIHKHEQGR